MSAPDPYLVLPLAGVQRIEASAGTGKTFTLATLVVRLVVERGLRIGQVLAVTYTEAATQELRKRIRERLQLTLRLLDSAPNDDDGAEAALTHALLQRHRASSGEDLAALRRRLRQAVLEIDLAAIHTIHGFCARVLREHALDAGQGFDAPELLANDRELYAEVAADLWRVHAQDATTVEDLAALWPNGHDELARDLPALLQAPVVLPPAALPAHDPTPVLGAASATLVEAIEMHGEDARKRIARAFDGKVFDGRRARRPSFDKAFEELDRGRATGRWPRTDKTHLQKLLPAQLRDYCKEGQAAQIPASPLFDALAAWCTADDAMEAWLARRRAALLHRLRDEGRARVARLKHQRGVQGYDDLIAGVAAALDGAGGEVLARALRAQYAVALVDEFQDTDDRQWRIFDRVFGRGSPAPTLFVIGDPKQAIYGFRGGDVHTYLAASAAAAHAPDLRENFRSRPALLAALAALYANAGDMLSRDPDIAFHPVVPGGNRSDADFLRDGLPAPALTVWQAPPPPTDDQGKRKPWRAGEARALATRACVAAIHDVLSQARNRDARIEGKPVQPGDIAVLVRTHHEATRVQQALALAGIPAVAAGKQSLFATAEARELQVLLLALLHGGNDGRLRAALATVLVGEDAAAIDALDRDGDAHRAWQLQAQHWRDRLRSGGPLALVGDLCAAQAERLLGLLDGERRVSNYLQLAEQLQDAQRQALGLQGLAEWLARRIARADANDEAQLLRLESDARRVQIVTLHKSKGLEYPLVFLPFIGIGGKTPSPGRYCSVHDQHAGRRLHWKFEALPEAGWAAAQEAWKREQTSEQARLLYVGLTRARHALWLASGAFYNADKTALHPLLRDQAALAGAGVVFDASEPPTALPRLPVQDDAPVPAARPVLRRLATDWWVHSFSQLAKADAGLDTASAATLPVAGGNDEPEAPDDEAGETRIDDPRFAGNRYGVALHAAFEHADFAAWRDWREGDAAPADEARVIAGALRAEGYAEDVLDDGIALTTRLIGHTLTVPLPEGLRLCDLPDGERRAEIEFQFSLQPTRVDALLALLHAHGVVRERHGFGLRQRLDGLMTGLIDLTYRHDGRWYVLDYKSNRLPAYDAGSLQRAMQHSEYDLQALLYTLALHRWLRFRLGDGYDYARDFGGIRYLFCRGLDAARDDGAGLHAQRFAPALIHALDALFGLPPGEAAA
ncbi:UvrD-helicase domain-containing protein [Thermomonas mangrovi]|uniref:UvrD-helicase domain-containing protein n=1 Tax=Thermomonas mangrovi TaxID=2993316 RepID=UPI0023071110|nr:exodeoxyribonuclease V subunit beta [Thermomonas mangrovi]